jgi:hypothetical protein
MDTWNIILELNLENHFSKILFFLSFSLSLSLSLCVCVCSLFTTSNSSFNGNLLQERLEKSH